MLFSLISITIASASFLTGMQAGEAGLAQGEDLHLVDIGLGLILIENLDPDQVVKEDLGQDLVKRAKGIDHIQEIAGRDLGQIQEVKGQDLGQIQEVQGQAQVGQEANQGQPETTIQFQTLERGLGLQHLKIGPSLGRSQRREARWTGLTVGQRDLLPGVLQKDLPQEVGQKDLPQGVTPRGRSRGVIQGSQGVHQDHFQESRMPQSD